MDLFLALLSGIGWMIVYEECIRLGLKEKTYSMPFFALVVSEFLNFEGMLNTFHLQSVQIHR